MFAPAVTLAGPVLVTARSATRATTEVAAVAELLAGFGSAVAVLAEAVLVIVVPAPAALDCTTSVKAAVEPEGSEAMVQVTVPVAPTAGVGQGKPAAAPRGTNGVPAGTLSVNTVDCAACGPLLGRPMEEETFPPATTVSGPVLVMARSAAAVTITVKALPLLLDGSVSAVAVLADAVLVIVFPNVPGAALTASVKEALAPADSGAIVPVIGPPAPTAGVAHVNAGPEPCANDTNVVPGGIVSLKETDCAGSGPLLMSVMP